MKTPLPKPKTKTSTAAAKRTLPRTATKLTSRALGRATLARQMLLAREDTTILGAVERLVGLQAQWPAPPFIGLWTRMTTFAPADLSRALHGRTALRGTMMRGTIHVVSRGDYLAFRPVIQPILTRGIASVLKDRTKTIDADALLDEARAFYAGEPRTFAEVRDHLMSLHPKGDARAMGFTVRMLLSLVMVPTDAKWAFPADARFTVAEAWLGERLSLSRADGSAGAAPTTSAPVDARTLELALRYFAAFGPASVSDLQGWSGLKKLRDVVDALRPQLVTFEDERGRELFDLPDAPRPEGDVVAPPRFLPEFDNLLLGHDDRTRFVTDAHRTSIYLSGLRVASTYLLDGRVSGTWKIARAKGAAELVVQPFAVLAKKDREALAAEGDALLAFTDAESTRRKLVFLPPIG